MQQTNSLFFDSGKITARKDFKKPVPKQPMENEVQQNDILEEKHNEDN